MIRFNLRCAKNHEFEAWFRDNAAFDAQVKRRDVTCPYCASRKIEKAIMAPRIAKNAGKDQQTPDNPVSGKVAAGEALTKLKELQQKIEENCDYVGDKFAEEARKIHYGENDQRGIYGESTEAEARELAEEGIEFARIPWLPRYDS